MSFQDMLNSFQLILNRDDCSAAQAQNFLQQGISRILRDCRLPCMERALIVTVTDEPMPFIVAPSDLLQPIDLIWQEPDGRSRALEKLSYRQLLKIDPLNNPTAYARVQNQFWIAGAVQPGQQITLLYYGNFSPFASASSDNELSASSPDLAVYAALSYAGQTYQHPAAEQWETIYQAIKAEVVQMAIDLDAEGGPQAVQSLYAFEDV